MAANRVGILHLATAFLPADLDAGGLELNKYGALKPGEN